ncbi:MAG: NUDIX hydrolase [Candidatus Dependentiae bacterium]
MFFPSAKIIVKHQSISDKILLIKRNVNGIISYEPAGGRAEIDYATLNAESLEECVIREAAEELGVRVNIERYLGSYSYFWPHDLSKCSCYAVFIGTIIDDIKNFTGNGDKDCWPVEPEWVSLGDIINKKIVINPTHKGLEQLVLDAFK